MSVIICILLAFVALGLACAVAIGSRRPARPDPFSEAFGEMPGFTAEQLARLAVRTGDPLRRSLARRWPHRRPLYAQACIRCGASTSQDLAGDCIPDPFENAESGGVALRAGAGSGFPFLSGLAAARSFFRTEHPDA